MDGYELLVQGGLAAAGVGALRTVLGGSLKVSGEMLADQLYFWQWKNRVRLGEQVLRICKEKNISPKSVKADFVFPILEASGNVENNELQDLWAKLLVSGMENPTFQHPAYIRVLQEMSPNDAKVLQWVCSLTKPKNWTVTGLLHMENEIILPADLQGAPLGPEGIGLSISIANLSRLGICKSEPIRMEGLSTVRLLIDDFGQSFIKAVTGMNLLIETDKR